MDLQSVNFILDSGAFSADMQGTSINIEEYMGFIEAHDIKNYFNLDVIGDWKGTWKNQEVMEDNGFFPIPVYHVEDPIRYLDRCIQNYEYFALGGMAGGVSEQTRQLFLDKCWEKICPPPTYMPTNKVHGLGLASPLLVARYPWYSADTASGIHYGRYGIIIIPRKGKGGVPDYLSPPYSIYITERSTTKSYEGKHILNVAPAVREWIYGYIKSRGFNVGKLEVIQVEEGYELQADEKFTDRHRTHIERVIEDGIVSNGTLRDYFNIDFYMQMERVIPTWPWPFKPKVRGLF
jgi:hypothetical protein